MILSSCDQKPEVAKTHIPFYFLPVFASVWQKNQFMQAGFYHVKNQLIPAIGINLPALLYPTICQKSEHPKRYRISCGVTRYHLETRFIGKTSKFTTNSILKLTTSCDFQSYGNLFSNVSCPQAMSIGLLALTCWLYMSTNCRWHSDIRNFDKSCCSGKKCCYVAPLSDTNQPLGGLATLCRKYAVGFPTSRSTIPL